jgi:hypothetical protein
MTTKNDDDPVDPFSDGKLHPVGGVQKILSTSKSTVERLKATGKLAPWVYVGSRPYIKGSDLKRYIDNLPSKQPRQPTDDNQLLPEAAE